MKQSGKTLLAGVTMSLLSMGASAADISHGPVVLDFLDGTTTFESSFRANNANNTFADKFLFNISTASLMETQLSSISSHANNGLGITGFSIKNAAGLLVANGVQESSGDIDLWSIQGLTLNPGSYYVQVNGYVVSRESGSFTGNLNLTPVPEPETWAMMLGGLSVMAALARRRQKKA